jgi:hypothetical protein
MTKIGSGYFIVRRNKAGWKVVPAGANGRHWLVDNPRVFTEHSAAKSWAAEVDYSGDVRQADSATAQWRVTA